MIIKSLSGKQPQTSSVKKGVSVIKPLKGSGVTPPPKPIETPTTEPIQITPTQKKIDLKQITSKAIPKIKYIAETIIKGLKLTLKEPVQTAILPPTKVQVPKAKEVFSTENIVKSFKQAVSQTPAVALVKGVAKQTKTNIDIISGILSSYNTDIKQQGGQNFEAQPNAIYNPKNKEQAFGVMAYGLLKYGYAMEAGGINAAIEGATKSVTLTPKFQFVKSVVGEFASKQTALLLNKLKPLKLTIQDLNDVTRGVATPEQLVRFNQANVLKEAGLPIRDILAAAEKSKTSPTTKLYDFLKSSIEDIVSSLKASLSPEEQKLLTAGNKLEQLIPQGEHTSQELVGKVMASGLEKTPEGKQIIKVALDAQNQGKNVVVSAVEKPVVAKAGLSIPKETPQISAKSSRVGETHKVTPQAQKVEKPIVGEGGGVTVPKEQLPVGEGKIKASKLEARLKGVVGNATREQIENLGLSTYKTMNKAEQLNKASQYVVNNQDEALAVLRGEVNPPKGIVPESIYIALTELAKDDLTLATKMTTLQATALGQRISILSEINKDSPVVLMNDVYKVRAKAFEARTGKTVKEAVKTEVQRIRKEIKIPDKYDWSGFLDSIECK
jgi:hypothetical protein